MLSYSKSLAVSLASVLVTACGGGGSVNDGTTPLAISPAKLEATSPGCRSSLRGPEVIVTGGVAPYTIHNPFKDWIILSTPVVRRGGETFRIDIVGGACLDNIVLKITDSDATSVELTVSHQPTTN